MSATDDCAICPITGSPAVHAQDNARSRINAERRLVPGPRHRPSRAGRGLSTRRRYRFRTVAGRKRSSLISGWFGLGSGLELLSPVVVS